MNPEVDIAIVGGGPAGLSSALVAGRAKRRVLVVDGGTPRNAAAPNMRGFLSRDGIDPREFRRIAHAELMRYPTIERIHDLVESVTGRAGSFEVTLEGGRRISARRVLLAVGVTDRLPSIEGVEDLWGKGVHSCPYCDGFECRDDVWGVLVDRPALYDYAQFLTAWAAKIVVFTNGNPVPDDKREQCAKLGAEFVPEHIGRIRGGAGDTLEGVELASGRLVPLVSFWVHPKHDHASLVRRLGVQLMEEGGVWTSEQGETSMPGIFAAGDCACGSAKQAVLAAADGARVTFPIVHGLILG